MTHVLDVETRKALKKQKNIITKHDQGNELTRIGLGGGHADLRPGVYVYATVGLA